MAFAVGTFTTISFVEIIESEMSNRTAKEVMLRGLAMTVGFVIVAISSLVEAFGN